MTYLEPTGIPVLSEEGAHLPYEERRKWNRLWIVDPLDGTKEFIKRNGEFTVNIALVEHGTPVMGVIYVPVKDELYYGQTPSSLPPTDAHPQPSLVQSGQEPSGSAHMPLRDGQEQSGSGQRPLRDGQEQSGSAHMPLSGPFVSADVPIESWPMQGAWHVQSASSRPHLTPLPLREGQGGGSSLHFTVVASPSHLSPETEAFIADLRREHPHLELVSSGSSLKICLVAEGKADIYPRHAPTMEWDTAAGHAIALAAGHEMVDATTGQPLTYNKPDLHNPWFIVR